jgi:hypothetical protein
MSKEMGLKLKAKQYHKRYNLMNIMLLTLSHQPHFRITLLLGYTRAHTHVFRSKIKNIKIKMFSKQF